jgi:protein ImuB
MPLAEALSLEPRLAVVEENPQRDREALECLASWAERYTPFVGLEEGDEPCSLLLDSAGSARYFRGEDNLVARVQEELALEGWVARIALADTLGAAWALAHYGPIPSLAPPGETENYLRPLPVAALRLPTEVLGSLAALGIKQIEQLLTLPRWSLPARFGPSVLLRIDQALGRIPEVFVSHRLLPEVQAVHTFEYPVEHTVLIHAALDQLVERIQQMLEKRGLGARQLECWLYHESASPLRLSISFFCPTRSARHLCSLLDARLEQIQATEPIRALALRVTLADPLGQNQLELFETQALEREKLSMLVDRLSNRLGCDAVTRASLVADAQPEYAYRFDPLVSPGTKVKPKRQSRRRPAKQAPPCELRLARRPLCLWPKPLPIQTVSLIPDGPPIRFRWAGEDYRIHRSWGPERVETGWWRADDIRRDYYMVMTHLGNRFWIFRRRDNGCWFLHGVFD